ncbi:MAG: fumarate hydratase C-terminal domain-containing protein [Thermovirgaceae bacterium]|nr:fumarate hydratase C-terminal domain-containing protein [Synergistales bacterium]
MRHASRLVAPLDDAAVRPLRSGDRALISGVILTALDEAHRRMAECARENRPLPFDLEGQVICYLESSPTPPGRVCGPVGPGASGRMDPYTPLLLDLGLKGMIGRGRRSPEVIDSIVKNGAVYFGAVGGAAVLLSGYVTRMESVAWPEMGPEAVFRMRVEDLPVVVLVDAYGNDLYREGPARYRRGSPPSEEGLTGGP